MGAVKAVTLGLGLVVLGGGGVVYFTGLPHIQIQPAPEAPSVPDRIALPASLGTRALVEPPRPLAPEVAPEPLAKVQEPPAAPRIGFDLVRVEADGSAVIAGRGMPGQTVVVTLNGDEISRVDTDRSGQFVSFAEITPAPLPRLLELRWRGADGAEVIAPDTVVIAPTTVAVLPPVVASLPQGTAAEPNQTVPQVAGLAPELPQPAPTAQAPELFRADVDGITPLAPRALPAAWELAIDSISYGDAASVVIQGRSGSAGTVRLSLDGAATGPEVHLSGPGAWRLDLTDVAPGQYELSVGLTGPQGGVLAESSTPFQRVAPEDVPDQTGIDVVTVQPGYSLWRIARDRYGSGVNYVQVFDANRDQIRNPDLIYPGQVLALPEER